MYGQCINNFVAIRNGQMNKFCFCSFSMNGPNVYFSKYNHTGTKQFKYTLKDLYTNYFIQEV